MSIAKIALETMRRHRPLLQIKKDFANNRVRRYGEGEGDVLTLMSVLVSVVVDVAGDGFTMVVLVSFFSVFSVGGLVTVVSFCSHAANKAAPIKRQMYFFMSVLDEFGS